MKEDLVVIVFPADRHLWASDRRKAVVRLDKDGQFAVKSLPP